MSATDRGFPLRLALWGALIVAGVALWLLCCKDLEEARAWRSLLVNFIFFTSLTGGLVVWPALAQSCNGRWHAGIEEAAAAGSVFALPSLLLLIALWFGSPHWSPWYGARFHQGIWLSNTFVFGRDVAALLFFWGVALRYRALRRRGEGKVTAAILLLVYALSFTLLGFDLVMALDPHWHSSLAGGYFFMSGLYIAVTAWAFLAVWRPQATPEQLHDLGRLVVSFSLMAAYLMYSHLLPIWYENLPAEVRFVAPRMGLPDWRHVSYLLLAVVYFGPLVLLLMERAKKNRYSLGAISLLVLCGMWLERWWLVVPTFEPEVRFGMAEASSALACIGVLGVGMELYHRRLLQRRPREES